MYLVLSRSFVFVLLWILSATNLWAEDSKRPNVVFLLADDLGWTGLRCFGSDFYETPNLDALAGDGIKLTNSYAACTVCSPTRASIMTGMSPARLRCTYFIAGQFRPKAKLLIPNWTKQLESRHVTIAEALQAGGYRTAHVGKWHLEAKGKDAASTGPLRQGFDISIQIPAGTKGYLIPQKFLNDLSEPLEDPAQSNEKGEQVYLTDWLTDKACEVINENAESARPFFLYFAYHTPHTPIQGRADLVQEFKEKADPTATHNNPTYAAMVASLDQSVGRIVESLRNNGIANNTIVIFTSDNGGLTQRYGVHDNFTENLPLRRGKGSAFEGGVRVPTIIRWPNELDEGAVIDEPIMTIDYYPTLLSACNVAGDARHNANVDGVNLMPLLQGEPKELDRHLFWHYPHYHAGGDGPFSAVRSGNYRLIEFLEDNSLQLYDLAQDLAEQNDLADRMPDKTEALRGLLHRWRSEVDAQMPTPNPNYDPTAPRRPKKRTN
ncbi:MAG: sulfatase [Planctomycetota bacterium]